MNWLVLISAMAIVALVIAVITDIEITRCKTGSFYQMVHLCRVESPSPASFDCRYDPKGCNNE